MRQRSNQCTFEVTTSLGETKQMPSFAVMIAAAGKSARYKDDHYKKQFAPLKNRAVWLHSAERFLNRDDVKQTIVIIDAEDREMFIGKFGANIAIMGIDVVEGGTTRAESVKNGLEQVRDDIDFVAVHDAARPCIADVWIDDLFSTAAEHGAAVLGIPVSSSLKRVEQSTITDSISRDGVWESQTPQVFARHTLVDAYIQVADAHTATDEAELVQRNGVSVRVVHGSPLNRKITTKGDLRFAEIALSVLPKKSISGPAHPFGDDDMWR